MANNTTVSIRFELLDVIFEGAKRLHPKETLMLLRGKKKKDILQITDLLVPPLATYGYGFANLPLHMLPMDFSLVGMVHSHPSGNLTASDVDYNHFFGRIMMIVGYPYFGKENVVVYNCRGEKLPVEITRQPISRDEKDFEDQWP
jgi:proteasome lid subunit RPN8/RPN11